MREKRKFTIERVFMNQRDLLELEQAARTIVAVVERNRISDETAAERRENFILLPGGGNYQPQKEKDESSFEDTSEPTTTKNERENTIPRLISFNNKELRFMPNKELRDYFRNRNLADHIRQKENGTYEIRYMINGVNYYGASKNLKEAMQRFIQNIIKKTKCSQEETLSTPIERPPALVRDYAHHYLDTFKKPNICEKAFKNYKRTTNNHIAPHFNGIYVKDVTASDCQALLNKILAEGKGRISEDVKNLMTWIFETAVADKILLSNPMNSVQIPKHRRKNGKQILVDIMYAYLSNPPKDRYDYIIRFIAYTGIRPCEIASAKFENGFVTIKNAKQKPNEEPTYRTIPIHSDLAIYIDEIKKYLNINLTGLGRAFKKKFPPEYRLYDLRHTFTSRIQECKATKSWVDYVTNHTGERNTTDRVYTHWSDDFQREEMEKLNFSPKSVPKTPHKQ